MDKNMTDPNALDLTQAHPEIDWPPRPLPTHVYIGRVLMPYYDPNWDWRTRMGYKFIHWLRKRCD